MGARSLRERRPEGPWKHSPGLSLGLAVVSKACSPVGASENANELNPKIENSSRSPLMALAIN